MNAGDRTPHAQHLAELHRPRDASRLSEEDDRTAQLKATHLAASSHLGSRLESTALERLARVGDRSSKTFPSVRHQTRRPSRRRLAGLSIWKTKRCCAQRARRPCALPLQTRARAFRVGSSAHVPESRMNAVIIGRREVEDRSSARRRPQTRRPAPRPMPVDRPPAGRGRSRSVQRCGPSRQPAHQDVITIDGPHAWLERPDELTQRVKSSMVPSDSLRSTAYLRTNHNNMRWAARQSSLAPAPISRAPRFFGTTLSRDDEGVVHFWPRLVRGWSVEATMYPTFFRFQGQGSYVGLDGHVRLRCSDLSAQPTRPEGRH